MHMEIMDTSSVESSSDVESAVNEIVNVLVQSVVDKENTSYKLVNDSIIYQLFCSCLGENIFLHPGFQK